MLVQALVLPTAGTGAGPDAQLLWTALLLRVVLLGPGPLSLDRLLRPGLDSSALPGGAAAGRVLAALQRRGGPAYQLGLRLWLAAAPAGMALATLGVANAMRAGIAPGLPVAPMMVARVPPFVALGAGLLLATGTATRLAALGLLALVPLGQIVGAGDARLPWALLLAAIMVRGAGPLSVDGLFRAWLHRRAPPVDRTRLPHVVVVGGGFGGIAAVRGLCGAACRITLVDQRNHHLFQPLLYQVAHAAWNSRRHSPGCATARCIT
jgi:NADH dehydrogenase/putative oxidoreductase